MTDSVDTELSPELGQIRRRSSLSDKKNRPAGILLITEEDILSEISKKPDDEENYSVFIDQNDGNRKFKRRVNPIAIATHSEINDAIKRLRPVKQKAAEEIDNSTRQVLERDENPGNILKPVGLLPLISESSSEASVPVNKLDVIKTGIINTSILSSKQAVHNNKQTYKHKQEVEHVCKTVRASQHDVQNNNSCQPQPDEKNCVGLQLEENPYASIDDVIQRKRPPVPKLKYSKSNCSPTINVPTAISEGNYTLSVKVAKDPQYECMTPKVPLPLPPRDDLSESNIPPTIETNFKGLVFRYEAFIAHIHHAIDPFDANFTQDNFSAGIFREEGGILNVNGAHLMVPKGAFKKSTVLFLYRADKDCTDKDHDGEFAMQYQVSPVIIVGPVTTLEECIFLSIDLYVVDDKEWTYESLSRLSNVTDKWKSMEESNISLQCKNRWIYTIENLTGVTEFKLIGIPKRKIEGIYDVPIDHFIMVKMNAVIDDENNNELSITVRKLSGTDSTNSNKLTDKTILLNQLGGEFLLTKLFGQNEKIHIGSIICGRQTSVRCSYKIPNIVHRNASIEFRQELKERSFQINIIHKETSLKSMLHNSSVQWEKDLRIFSTLLSRNRFQVITGYGQCDHWVQFCRLAFNFSDAQSTHFRTLPYCRSLAINLYTAINDTCGNTLEVLTPLKTCLEDADILLAATAVEEEIQELLSLCDKRISGDYVHADSEPEDDGNDDIDDNMDSMHASLRRKTMTSKK